MKKLFWRMSILSLSCFISAAAHAATFVVNTTDDPPPIPAPNGCNTGGNCSLREAVLAANVLPDPDIIELGANTYNLTIPKTVDNPEDGDLDVQYSTTFQGAGQTTTIINAVQPALADRVLEISGSSVGIDILDLTIQGGISTGDGGGVYGNNSLLNLANCQIINNEAASSGGGVSSFGGVTIDNCVINNNIINGSSGGGIYFSSSGGMSISNSTVNENRSTSGGSGGGIYFSSSGSLSVINTQVNGNRFAGGGTGGGIYHSAAGGLQLIGSQVNQNVLETGGLAGGLFFSASGSLDIQNSQIDQNSIPVSSGGAGGLYISSGALNTISNSSISGNTIENGTGGGIYASGFSLELTNTQVSGNTATGTGPGGGMYFSGSNLILTGTTLDGNRVEDPSGQVGGLYSSASFVGIYSSTISNNFSAGYFGGAGIGASDMEITNSTVTGNQANLDGGGLYLPLTNGTINNVTIAGNTADADGNGDGSGGGIFAPGPFVTFQNTILAQNSDDGEGPDCYGGFLSGGYNIIGTNSINCPITPPQGDPASTDLYGANPDLGPLQNNGGPTDTLALLSGSAALDAGNPAGCTDGSGTQILTDQRGQTRPAGTACDIGAFQLGSVDLSVEKTSDAAEYLVGDTITFTIVVTNNGPDSDFNVVLEDILPSEVSFQSVDSDAADCSEAAGTVNCLGAQLDAGESITVTIVALAETIGDTSNTATVLGSEEDTDPSNSSSTVAFTINGNPDFKGGGCGCELGAKVAVNPALLIAFGALSFGVLAFRRRLSK